MPNGKCQMPNVKWQWQLLVWLAETPEFVAIILRVKLSAVVVVVIIVVLHLHKLHLEWRLFKAHPTISHRIESNLTLRNATESQFHALDLRCLALPCLPCLPCSPLAKRHIGNLRSVPSLAANAQQFQLQCRTVVCDQAANTMGKRGT